MVITWMNLADHAIAKAWDEDPRGFHTPRTARADAQVSLAVFEAVNSVDRRYTSYLSLAPAEAGASADAAAAAAAHAVLCALLPAQKSTFDDALIVALAQVPDGAGEAAGVAAGTRAGVAAMSRAALKPVTPVSPYRPRVTPGAYIDPGLPSIQPFDLAMPPFVLTTAADLRPAAPPPLSSETYARDLEEVRRLGAKETRDRSADKNLLARAWLEIDLARVVEDVARRPGRSLVDNARLYARADLAMEDTWLAVMEAKMHYGTWRPITAIRNADQDGNAATTHEPGWEPLLRTPTHVARRALSTVMTPLPPSTATSR